MFKNILLPTDGSASSDIAIQKGIRFAKAIGAKVTGVHVVPPFQVFSLSPDMLEDSRELYDKESTERASKFLRAIEQQAAEAGVPCETVSVKSDEVYQAIIQAAFDKQCDLIAMASHGRKGISAVLLGSETQKVLTHSQIPVLVFR